MAKVEESYGYKAMSASGPLCSNGCSLGGFACTVTGTIKLTLVDGAGATVQDTIPVTAGVFLPLPVNIPPGNVLYATLAGGAAGTFYLNQGT